MNDNMSMCVGYYNDDLQDAMCDHFSNGMCQFFTDHECEYAPKKEIVTPSGNINGLRASHVIVDDVYTKEKLLADPELIIQLARQVIQAKAARNAVAAERDEAVRTKAYINGKRTVTAMRTSALAVRRLMKAEKELSLLKKQLKRMSK